MRKMLISVCVVLGMIACKKKDAEPQAKDKEEWRQGNKTMRWNNCEYQYKQDGDIGWSLPVSAENCSRKSPCN